MKAADQLPLLARRDVRCPDDCRSLSGDCVAKVESCRVTSQIFRENTKREAIADSYRRNRVVEVACEFNVRR